MSDHRAEELASPDLVGAPVAASSAQPRLPTRRELINLADDLPLHDTNCLCSRKSRLDT